MDDKGCRKTPSLRVQTAPELEDAGRHKGRMTHEAPSFFSFQVAAMLGIE